MITALIFIPLVGALALYVGRPRNARAIALMFHALCAFYGLMLWQKFDTAAAGMQLLERHAWIPTVGAQYLVGVDGLSLLLVLLNLCMLHHEEVDAACREERDNDDDPEEASYLFCQWATNKANAVRELMAGVGVGRTSTWDSPEVKAKPKMPADWYQGAPEVSVDREEIMVVGTLKEAKVDGNEDAQKAAAAGRVDMQFGQAHAVNPGRKRLRRDTGRHRSSRAPNKAHTASLQTVAEP